MEAPAGDEAPLSTASTMPKTAAEKLNRGLAVATTSRCLCLHVLNRRRPPNLVDEHRHKPQENLPRPHHQQLLFPRRRRSGRRRLGVTAGGTVEMEAEAGRSCGGYERIIGERRGDLRRPCRRRCPLRSCRENKRETRPRFLLDWKHEEGRTYRTSGSKGVFGLHY